MDISYVSTISTEDYSGLRASVGWGAIPENQVRTGLSNTAYLVAARKDGETVGMARLISDGGYVNYIADVIVRPDCQGHGIGKAMMERILAHIRNGLPEGGVAMVCLVAVKGKEPFYRKLAFEERPNETHGAGMSQWIRK